MKIYKAGYYRDQSDDISIVYPCGRIEVINFWNEWDIGGGDGYYFQPMEYLGPL